MEKTIALISAATALAAVVIGPAVTMYVARRQIRASTLAANRQQWINTLRDELSNYLAAMAVTGARSASGAASNAEHLSSIEVLCRLESKIRLLLNPHESDHADLVMLLRQASASCYRANVTDVSEMPKILDDYRERIISKSQAVLKREWNRVKTLT